MFYKGHKSFSVKLIYVCSVCASKEHVLNRKDVFLLVKKKYTQPHSAQLSLISTAQSTVPVESVHTAQQRVCI